MVLSLELEASEIKASVNHVVCELHHNAYPIGQLNRGLSCKEQPPCFRGSSKAEFGCEGFGVILPTLAWSPSKGTVKTIRHSLGEGRVQGFCCRATHLARSALLRVLPNIPYDGRPMPEMDSNLEQLPCLGRKTYMSFGSTTGLLGAKLWSECSNAECDPKSGRSVLLFLCTWCMPSLFACGPLHSTEAHAAVSPTTKLESNFAGTPQNARILSEPMDTLGLQGEHRGCPQTFSRVGFEKLPHQPRNTHPRPPLPVDAVGMRVPLFLCKLHGTQTCGLASHHASNSQSASSSG